MHLRTALLAAIALAAAGGVHAAVHPLRPQAHAAAAAARPDPLGRFKSWEEAWAALSPYGRASTKNATVACASGGPVAAANCGVRYGLLGQMYTVVCCLSKAQVLLSSTVDKRCPSASSLQDADTRELYSKWKARHKLSYNVIEVSMAGGAASRGSGGWRQALTLRCGGAGRSAIWLLQKELTGCCRQTSHLPQDCVDEPGHQDELVRSAHQQVHTELAGVL